ncbi:MAG: glycosyltransferase, partial [Candidatus Thermoplasmatota archaeon]|nr:glycosyltransferase [Candidatus Thermoplasmatota archaeon]
NLLLYSWRACKKGKDLNKKNKYTLVHAFFGIPCGFIAKKIGTPYIVSLRGSDVPFYNPRFYWMDKLLFKRLSKYIWKHAKAVISNSSDLKKLACKIAPNQKIEIINNGVNTNEFKPGQKKDDEFVIISTSRFTKRKGIKYLISAFIRFNKLHPNSRLLLAGSGGEEQALFEQAKNSGIQDKIDFLGIVKHNAIKHVYRLADVFVLPSLNEGMSNSLLEAISSGLAIITTDTGGSNKIVDDQNGIFIKKQSQEDIFHALEALYFNAEILKSKKESSRERAKQFTWKSVAEQYMEKYCEDTNY